MTANVRPATGTVTGTVGDDLRLALRRLAKAVVIITAMHDGVRHAMAATAVSELSVDPPSMLVCVNKTASIHSVLDAGAPFCINILDRLQEDLARHCSGALKGEARFAKGDWAWALNGAPYLPVAQAAIVCERELGVTYGTHSIFIGRVNEVHVSGEVAPLIYMDGAYTSARSSGDHHGSVSEARSDCGGQG